MEINNRIQEVIDSDLGNCGIELWDRIHITDLSAPAPLI